MILSTTPTIEGKPAHTYLGVIGAEVIFGANFLKDWMAQGTDLWGGRNRVYEKVFEDARVKALSELQAKAISRGASAIVNIRFDYQVLGETNGMLMVAATGTAVNLGFSEEDKAAQLAIEKASKENYYLTIDGRERGPFSRLQIGELFAAGKITGDTSTRDETGKSGLKASELLLPEV